MSDGALRNRLRSTLNVVTPARPIPDHSVFGSQGRGGLACSRSTPARARFCSRAAGEGGLRNAATQTGLCNESALEAPWSGGGYARADKRSGGEAGIPTTPGGRTLAASRPATKRSCCQRGPTLNKIPFGVALQRIPCCAAVGHDCITMYKRVRGVEKSQPNCGGARELALSRSLGMSTP